MRKYKELPNVKCSICGYQNKAGNVSKYGTCKLYGSVLDAKAKFEYEMFCKLHMWRNKKRGERI